MDINEVKQRSRKAWGLGDYTELARILEPAATAVCDACAISAGQEVLDVGAGNGNFALAAAREGAAVVASDLSPRMVELGRSRTEAAGYGVEWLEADAEELPFEAARFDCVGSVFGAMIAPRPERVAAELFRVVRPGGSVGMTAWTRESFAVELFDVGRRFLPPPEDMPLPHEWGDEAIVRERFEGLAASIDTRRLTLPWKAGSPEELVERLATSAGPQVAAKQSLPPDRYEAMRSEWIELAQRRNAAADDSLRIDAEYLLTVARKRG